MSPTRRSVLIASAATPLLRRIPPQVTELSVQTAGGIEAAVNAAIEAHACPGVAVGVMRRGELILTRGFGLANIETTTPVASDSVFRIGSLTKQFTAAAVVKLAAEGRLSLDDTAAKHLSFFEPLKPFTLRELLNHTAGLSDGDDSAPSAVSAGPRSSIDLAREIAANARPLDFESGAAWLYSNANYIVLGAVIEQVTGLSFAAAMRALVFMPASLSSLAVDSVADVVPGRVNGYSQASDESGYVNASPLEIADTGGAGAMRGAVRDLCRWHDALLSERLFDRRWLDEMLTPGRLRDGRVSGDNRFSPDDAHYGEVQYAMGLLVSTDGDGRLIQHYGYVNGFSACLETRTSSGVTLAMLCNGDVGPELPFRGVRRALNAPGALV